VKPTSRHGNQPGLGGHRVTNHLGPERSSQNLLRQVISSGLPLLITYFLRFEHVSRAGRQARYRQLSGSSSAAMPGLDVHRFSSTVVATTQRAWPGGWRADGLIPTSTRCRRPATVRTCRSTAGREPSRANYRQNTGRSIRPDPQDPGTAAASYSTPQRKKEGPLNPRLGRRADTIGPFTGRSEAPRRPSDLFGSARGRLPGSRGEDCRSAHTRASLAICWCRQ